jgi:pentatricopeptide repeat protein
VNPGIETWEVLIDCCAQDEHIPRAMFFLKEMIRSRKNIKPSEKILTVYFKILRYDYYYLMVNN